MTDALSLFPTAMAADGDSTRFETRLVPLMPALLAYFQRRVLPTEDAHDCVSETLVVLWRQRDKLPEDADALRAYSYGVARKVLQNQRRGRLRRDLLDESLRDNLESSTSNDAHSHDAEALLGVLGEKDRELVTLVVLDGFTIIEAAAVLGLRPGTARMRYSRARSRLRTFLS